jgi:4-amino-4-deoxy-L-arabinose transferase-like glycosyltransferase
MRRTYQILLAICLGALGLRLLLLPMIHNPGLHDQNYYYVLGQRLLNGEGFTIDFVWHYSTVPDDIEHPLDHWMPLAGIAVAAGMALGGENPQAALILFIIASAILPALVFIFAKQLELSDFAALTSAAFAAVVPDIVWNSLRTDTTILNMVLVIGSIVTLRRGLEKGHFGWFVLSGILGGLAYLNRNDSVLLLPMMVVLLIAYRLITPKGMISNRRLVVSAILVPVAFVLTITPWLIRNQRVLGMMGSPETSRMFFFTDQRDHYAYDTEFTLATMLEQRTVQELIAKRLFELVAAFKQMIISLDVILPLLVPIGLFMLIKNRDMKRLLVIAPVLIWIAGILVAYPLLIPYKSQSGSFEKAYLTILPMLLPLAALALDELIQNRNYRLVVVVLSVALMAANSFEMLRRETTFADKYYAYIDDAVTTLKSLPDVTGDGEIRLMTQDPFVMSYYGIHSVMIPLASREQTLEVAQHFQIDYVMMPPARPALDALYLQRETDSRFPLAERLITSDNRIIEFYALNADETD